MDWSMHGSTRPPNRLVCWIRSAFRPERSPRASGHAGESCALAPSGDADLVALDTLSAGECPLNLLRDISPPSHVGEFLRACESEMRTALTAIETAVEADSPIAALRGELHRLRNALSNACLSAHVAALPPPFAVEVGSAHYAEHLPVVRALVQQALQHLKSQPEYQDGP